jgi:hypothetical protein
MCFNQYSRIRAIHYASVVSIVDDDDDDDDEDELLN